MKRCKKCRRIIYGKKVGGYCKICVYDKTVSCVFCSTTYTRLDSYKRHLKRDHSITSGNVPVMECVSCRQVLSIHYYNNHIKECYLKRVKWVTCEFCQKSFIKEYYSAHVRIRHPGRNRVRPSTTAKNRRLSNGKSKHPGVIEKVPRKTVARNQNIKR